MTTAPTTPAAVPTEVDVIVVGSGAGAMTSAVLATRAGLSTLVMEKTALLGGTSSYSGAACWLPGSQVATRAGIPDSTEAARTYLDALLGDYETERREAFLTSAPLVVAALEEDPAISFTWQPFPDYYNRPGRVPQGRSFIPDPLPREEIGDLATLVRPAVDRDRAGLAHPDGPLVQGRALIGRLLLAAHRTGLVTVVTGAEVTELVQEDGRVVGVRTATGEEYRGSRGVILGSGGFERSASLREEYGVPGSAAWSMAPAGSNTGSALAAATELGAATTLLDEAWWCPGIAMPDGGASFTLGFHGGLVVDATGTRYANESLPYDQFGRAMAAGGGHVPSYVIFDGRAQGRLPAISLPGGKPADHLEAGTWVSAPTLAELAGLIGVPAATLEETVATFNATAAAGDDTAFGRGVDEYDRYFAPQGPGVIAEGPFTAARLVLSDLGTKGGVVTDTEARVLDGAGRPIAGLYAIGNASASLSGPVYPGPGVPLGTAMAFALRSVEDLRG